MGLGAGGCAPDGPHGTDGTAGSDGTGCDGVHGVGAGFGAPPPEVPPDVRGPVGTAPPLVVWSAPRPPDGLPDRSGSLPGSGPVDAGCDPLAVGAGVSGDAGTPVTAPAASGATGFAGFTGRPTAVG
ncbi:hypothetical protein UG55_10212 [Frankia sp. EI5c]|uniref:hypothetical protein n=1 Tax=Frankia sp. EI5c TaxID=683316 RepID=UPI0007C31369|nr:hypothetical protein [Frankia sp. EI5c]OAA25568.1 hypothetical protein UG55_10212 [Frankia sp. EI5c]